MNSVSLIKHNYKLSTRKYSVSYNNNYKIPSIGLIQSFKLINYQELKEKYNKDIVLSITIGNFTIVPYNLFTKDKDVIDIKNLRNYIREIDFPDDDYHNKLINFENFLFSQQLKCTEHYYTIKNSDLQNSIFTSGINVYIELKCVNESSGRINDESSGRINDKDTELQIEETFWDKIYEDKKQ
jgi:hypothetical protein